MMFAAFMQPFVLVLGILAITSEFRHGTITPSLLVSPDRVRLVLAKLAASVLIGLALGLLTSVLIYAIVKGIGGVRDLDTTGSGGKVILGTTVGTGLWAALGLGVGAILRNQVGAIVGSLVYLFVLENLLNIAKPLRDPVAKFGLTGLINGLTTTNSTDDHPPLHQLPAGLVLAGYCAIFLVIGIVLMKKRDITA
jgi:ABC-2 type transport system permease protein